MSQQDVEAPQDLAAENAELIQTLAHDGVGLDPLSLLQLRLDYLTGRLIPPHLMDNFNQGWEQQLNVVLKDAVENVNRAKLHVPPHQQMSIADALQGA